jgi:hypothetical protein
MTTAFLERITFVHLLEKARSLSICDCGLICFMVLLMFSAKHAKQDHRTRPWMGRRKNELGRFNPSNKLLGNCKE